MAWEADAHPTMRSVCQFERMVSDAKGGLGKRNVDGHLGTGPQNVGEYFVPLEWSRITTVEEV